MRAYLPGYGMIAPASLGEALRIMVEQPGVWKPMAGGTDLMVLFEAGRLEERKLLSIWKLPELRGIEETTDYITLGALTTYTQVQRSETMRREFPLLAQAAFETGGIATQNRGTLGGNIVNASPAADSPPALLVYGAALELVSASGSRWVDYQTFHTGYKRTILRPEELMARIRLPRTREPRKHYARKVGTRKAQAISKVCFAGVAEADGSFRIALGSVAPTVIRCPFTESVLRRGGTIHDARDAAREALAREVLPIDDVRSNAVYRLRVAQNLLEEFMHICLTTGFHSPLAPGTDR